MTFSQGWRDLSWICGFEDLWHGQIFSMVRNWCLWVAFGGCSRAGSAAALRSPFGVDQECSGASGTSQCQERLLGAGLAGSQREIRVTRAHDPMAAGAPSFHPPALSIQTSRGMREEGPGSCCCHCKQHQPRPSQQGEAVPSLWNCIHGSESLPESAFAELSCCQGVEKPGCAA